MDIKEYEIGEHCYGPILTVNGEDYENLDQKEVIGFINHMMENDINSDSLIYELFKTTLEYLQFEYDTENSRTSICGQCGHPNELTRWYNEEEQ